MSNFVTRVSDRASVYTLTQSEMENNATLIYNALSAKGWSLAAIAGALGNMQSESTINSGACEGGRGVPSGSGDKYAGGLGFIQWTDYPPYTGTYPNPVLWYGIYVGSNWYDGAVQCDLLNEADNPTITSCGAGQGARWGWQTSASYPSISFSSYKAFTGTPEEAAEYFYFDMEWHYPVEDGTLATRKQRARAWYDFLGGTTPQPPQPPDPPDPPTPPVPTGKEKAWLYFKFDDLRKGNYEQI